MPINMQFEVTYKCNNNCIFCYNDKQIKKDNELDTVQAKKILDDLCSNGVMSINFNGGEPLVRSDFLELAEYASILGLDIHLNTNASLIDDDYAKKLSCYFASVCTTLLSGDAHIHDELSGREGAFCDAINGIRALQANDIYVAVNVMMCNKNHISFINTLNLLRELSIRTLLITRYVPDDSQDSGLAISDSDFFNALRIAYEFNVTNHCFDRISLPQPIKLCSVPDDLKPLISEWNIPCNIGLCTASVNAYGFLTPCNLVKDPVLGDLKCESIKTIWKTFDGLRYCQESHLLPKCIKCTELECCGGGCKGYNMSTKE